MIPDVTINGVSMRSLGWLRETVDFPAPQSQSSTIVVPGRNSPIRFTEALGRVSYQPRSFALTFSRLGTRVEYNQLVREVINRFSGQLVRVICSEEPGLYALGTVEAAPSYAPLTGKGTLVLSCTDADAYFYHTQETVVTVTGSGTVLLPNDYMPVVPMVVTTAETTLRWTAGGESLHKTLSVGTWEIPELELTQGGNSISITAEGTTTFTYREGRL